MGNGGNGFILHLVAASRWSGAAAPALDSVIALRRDGWDARIGFLGGYQLQDRLEGIPWAAPLLTKPRTPWHVTDDISRLRETFRGGCALVHCHLNTDHLYAAVALRKFPGIPLLRTFHHEAHGRRDPLHRWAFRRAQRFVFVTPTLARALEPSLPPGIPRLGLPVSVDPSHFGPRPRSRALAQRLGMPPASFVFIHVGKIDRGRGQDLAVDVLATLVGMGIDAAAIIVGKGPALEAVRRRAAEKGVSDRVVLPGYCEEELPELYALADAALFPAAGSERGHRMILEAFATGLPVVSLGVPGSDDLVRQGVDGFVVPPLDVVAAAQWMAELARNRRRRSEMSDAARRRILETFADPIVARRLGEIYEEVLTETEVRSYGR
jgi:glycosyltransferase involved in cell wall biosynthesis